MSRLPPVPPASKSVHGPEGVAKTSVDVSHRVRHARQQEAGRQDGGELAAPMTAQAGSDFGWTMVAAVAALGLGYWAGRQLV